MRDGVLKNLRGGRGRSLVPERVDQPGARDDLVGVEQQIGKQRLFLAAANGDRPSVVDDLQRTQDAEFLPVPLLDGTTVFSGCLALGITAELPLQWANRGLGMRFQ